MKILVENIQFNLSLDAKLLNKNKIPIIFLHGFTGCAADWHFIFDELKGEYLPIAIDLIGHGKSDSPENSDHYLCSSILRQINSIVTQLEINKFIIAGYSMGGRVALSYSLNFPEKIIAAVYESTTAGIDDINAKKERVELDLLLADKIKNEGVESFFEYWFNTPLFESLKSLPNYDQIKANRGYNNVTGLSNSLAAFSTGLMSSYWDRLNTLDFPILLITGQRDDKYTNINKLMQSKLKNASHSIITGAGHNTHLEKPELFTKLVLEFLNSLKRQS